MAFNNYVVKKRGEGVSRKSKLGHVTNGRYRVLGIMQMSKMFEGVG